MPLRSEVHIDKLLTNLLIGARNEAYIADDVCPAVFTAQSSGKIARLDNSHYRLDFAARATGGTGVMVEWGADSVAFSSDEWRLEHPIDEVQIRLAILHAELPRPVVAPVLEAARAHLDLVLPEDLLDDVRRGHVGEHAAVRPATQEPELRLNVDSIERLSALIARELQARHDAVEVALDSVGQVHGDGELRTERVRDLDVLLREYLDL